MVILSDNPLTVPESDLVDIEVLLTMVGGNIEYTKEGSGLPGPDTASPIWFLLPPIAGVGLVIIVLVVFIRRR
jgi:hypothetical protein